MNEIFLNIKQNDTGKLHLYIYTYKAGHLRNLVRNSALAEVIFYCGIVVADKSMRIAELRMRKFHLAEKLR